MSEVRISMGYDVDIQSVLRITQEFIQHIGEMNTAKDATGLKKVLGSCESTLKKFNEEKNQFANYPKILNSLDDGTKLLSNFNRHISEVIKFCEEHEKKYGEDVDLKLNAKTCPAIKDIETGFKQIQEWVKELAKTWAKHGLKFEKNF